MRKATKKLLMVLLSFVFVVGVSAGMFAVHAEDAETATAENLATSAENWTNASAFTVKDDGMYANSSNVYAITKKKFGASNTLNYETAGTFAEPGATGYWCFAWLVLKQSDPSARYDPTSDSLSGNGVVFLWGASVADVNVIEFVNGQKVDSTTYKTISGYDRWYPYAITTQIEATVADTATGYTLDLTFTGSGTNTPVTINHVSTNASLKGNGYAQFGYFGTGTVGETTNYVLKDFSVTGEFASGDTDEPETPVTGPEELAPELENLATDANNFKGGLNAGSFICSDNGASAKGYAEMSISLAKDVKADSTIAVDIQGNASDCTWGEGWIIFKDVSVTQVADARQENETFSTLSSDMNYLAFRWGSSHLAAINEVTDGVLTETSIPWAQADYIHFYNGDRIRILITTTDTETGVHVEISFENYTKNKTLTYTYDSVNTKLHGDYAMNVGHYTGIKTTESIVYKKIGVTETVKKVDRSGLLNLATSVDYIKEGVGVKAFSYVEGEGLILEGIREAGMLMYQPVASAQTVTMQWNNSLVDGTYGNCYLIIKNLSGKYIDIPNPSDSEFDAYNATTDAEDNWLAVCFGGDGMWFYTCVNGQVERMSLGNGEDNNDVWHWYKQATVATITATDVAATETDDAYVRVTFTLTGPSGKLTTKSYDVYEEVFYGKDGLFQYSCFLSMGGNLEMNYDYVCLERLVYSDLKAISFPEADMDAINAKIAEYATVVPTNYEAVKTFYSQTAELRKQFNYTMNADFNADSFALLGTALEEYEAMAENLTLLIGKINALASEVNAENYQTVKTVIAAVQEEYAALPADWKALVTNYEAVTALDAAIKAYEESLKPVDPVDPADPEDPVDPADPVEPVDPVEPSKPGESGGCGSSAGASSVLGLVFLCGAVLTRKKK